LDFLFDIVFEITVSLTVSIVKTTVSEFEFFEVGNKMMDSDTSTGGLGGVSGTNTLTGGTDTTLT
jgi:hypothetical protein